ncbi:hypothetical protein M405DRAFT_845212 [Rhizopogon salebrosus TDB-379]|nr:hypothetical protein M405DRAFT_845212 [Rhizopogon salebrosus TDB-379]
MQANIQGCSIPEFNNHIIELLEMLDSDVPLNAQEAATQYYRAINLALTGMDTATGIQYSMEPTRNAIAARTLVSIVRDYDSLISFTDWIPIISDLFIYPVTNPVDTLKAQLHLKVPMRINSNRLLQAVFPHLVPNICLGVAGIRTKLRIFFPALYDPKNTDVELTKEQKAAIYEDGLRPCLDALNPETLTNWPVNYNGALTRATKRNGQVQYSTRPFPANMVERFGYDLTRTLVEAHPWARDMLYMIQVQGVKEANQHIPDDERAASNTIRNLVSDLDARLLHERHCWIDVGLELSQKGFAYQWRTDCHSRLMNHFTSMTMAQAAQYVGGSSRHYSKDISATLMHLSGFRASFALHNEDPVYMQAYTTDKALIYQLDGGRHGLAISGAQALKGTPPEFMDKIYDVYFDARDTHDCAARLELRVQAAYATTTALTIPMDVIRESLCVFERGDWWQWRLVRLIGLSRTLTLQNQGGGQLRVSPNALALTAGVVWLTNALHSRPDNGSAARDLMCTVLPLTRDYQQDMLQIQPRQELMDLGDMLPVCQFGAYFLRDIIWPPTADVPRMRHGQMMRNSTFKFFFGLDYEGLRRKHLPPAFIPRSTLPETRVRTQKGYSKRHRVDEPEPIPIFEELNFQMPVAQQDAGEDIPWEERLDLPPDLEEGLSVLLTKHWNQFCSDLLQKCGNLKGQPLAESHCRLSAEERQHVNDAVYKDMNLAMVFHRVQWKKVTGQAWKDAFDIFFSPRSAPLLVQPQNFSSMQYWTDWYDMKQRLPPSDFDAMRNKFWILFKELQWVPKPHKDRLWKYTPNNDFTTWPVGYNSHAPHIIVSPSSHRPTWVPHLVPGTQDAEDEQEEEAEGHANHVARQEWVNGMAPVPDRILRREEEEESDSDSDVEF